MTTQALDAITRLDEGLALPGDDTLAAVFDLHSSDDWARIDMQLDRHAADRCVICGRRGEGPECDTCTADWDQRISRTVDL